jgi:hypothetical protein
MPLDLVDGAVTPAGGFRRLSDDGSEYPSREVVAGPERGCR